MGHTPAGPQRRPGGPAPSRGPGPWPRDGSARPPAHFLALPAQPRVLPPRRPRPGGLPVPEGPVGACGPPQSHMRSYARTPTHADTCHTWWSKRTPAYMHACTCSHVHTCAHAYVQACVHARKYMHICGHAHTYTFRPAHRRTCLEGGQLRWCRSENYNQTPRGLSVSVGEFPQHSSGWTQPFVPKAPQRQPRSRGVLFPSLLASYVLLLLCLSLSPFLSAPRSFLGSSRIPTGRWSP